MEKKDYETLQAMPFKQAVLLHKSVLESGDTELIRDFILNDRFFLLTQVLGVDVALHPWVFERCREVEKDPDEHLDLWSRGHFKSTIITFAGTIQYVLNNPEDAVCIMSFKKGAADAFLAQIKTQFETNEILLKCFPDILWTERKDHKGDSWSVMGGISIKRKTARKENTVDSSGLVEGMKTGGHYDLLVYDDTVTLESVSTPDMAAKTTDAWSMSLNLGTYKTHHWYIGTRYSTYDTYAEMLKRGTIRERRHIGMDEYGKPVFLPQDEFDKKRAEMGEKDWASQFLQTPMGVGELVFKEEWFRYYSKEPSGMNIYIFADTALTVGKDSDYTVFWVVGLGRDANYYVLDIVRDKMLLGKRLDTLFFLVKKWMPRTVFYEINANRSENESIQGRMDDVGWHFDIVYLNQTIKKEVRIEWLQPVFEQHRLYFPNRILYKMFNGQTRDLIADFLHDEYLTFPSVTHDDMLDCLGNIKHPQAMKVLEFPRTPRREDDDYMKRTAGVFGKKDTGGGGVFVR